MLPPRTRFGDPVSGLAPRIYLICSENGVFGKRWFCLRDFRHFRRFPGFEERGPLFLWVECKSSFSPFFVKTKAVFGRGQKQRFQKHRFHNPEGVSDLSPCKERRLPDHRVTTQLGSALIGRAIGGCMMTPQRSLCDHIGPPKILTKQLAPIALLFPV